MVLNGPRLRAVFHCARDGPRFHRHSARGSRCRLRRKDRQPICMQRNAVRYRLSHACFARHDAVPIRRGFSLVRCRAGARRLRAQGIQRRATGDDAARTGGGHGPEQEFGAALHAYALDLGLPAQDPASKKFSLGPWSLELGMKYVQTSPLVLGGNPFLHSLNRNCQETCSGRARRLGHGVRGAFRHAQGNVREHAGRHAPAAVLHGGGRAVLSRLDPDVAHGLLERSDRRSHTAATITGMDALLAELEFARRHGYARSNGEFYPGDITVSAAVLDAGGIPWARSMCRFHPAAGRSNRRRPCLVRRWSKPRMPSACRAPWDVLIPSTSWSLPAALRATPISVAGEA